MLLIRTSIRPSAIHGLGCFTEEKISKGQLVWQYDERLDRRIALSELQALPAAAQEFLRMYAYFEKRGGQETLVLCGDNSRHMNHSDTPNLLESGEFNELNLAARDIEPGEELTCNYYQFDFEANEKLG